MSITSSCHLSLSAATLAASVNDRPMVATSFFAMSIQRNGGCPRGLSKHLHSCAVRGECSPSRLLTINSVCINSESFELCALYFRGCRAICWLQGRGGGGGGGHCTQLMTDEDSPNPLYILEMAKPDNTCLPLPQLTGSPSASKLAYTHP